MGEHMGMNSTLQRWRKLGLIYNTAHHPAWAVSHAQPPTPLVLDNGLIRLYGSFRDAQNIGRIGFADVDPSQDFRLAGVSQQPALDIGVPGTFDDNGTMPTSCVRVGDKIYMYYTGWQLGTQVPYFLFTGLAISEDGGETFTRHSEVPILERSDAERFTRAAAFVMHPPDNTLKMWYVGGRDWVYKDGKPLPHYQMRYIASDDGIQWGKEGKICLSYANDDEHGFGRPSVLFEDGIYKMWYSVRTFSKGYRLGYAESGDGITWTRLDEAVEALNTPDPDGADSDMIAFSALVPTPSATYLFYNGNNYGEQGICAAVLEG